MRRTLGLSATIALALIVLAGCADDTATSSGGEPTAAGSASTSSAPPELPTEEPSGEPTGESTDFPSGSPGAMKTYEARPVPAHLPRVRIEAANLHYAYLDRNAAGTPEEQAVVDAWMSYWQGTADTYYLQRPTALFESVARGEARRKVVDYMREKKAVQQRVMGYSIENVLSVQVDGATATLRDCTESFTFTVDRESEPLSRVMPFYDTTGMLEKTDGKWTVVDYEDKAMRKSCLR
jgi:hypothetical protein